MSAVNATVEIKKVRSHQPDTGHTVSEVRMLTYNGEEPKSQEPLIVGYFPSIFEGDEFAIEANWIEHPIFGYQLKIDSAERKLPQTRKGIQAFIQSHTKGVGRTIASRIVDAFKEDTLQVIEKTPERLLEIKGITKKKADEILQLLYKHQKFDPIAVFILNHGGSYKLALWAYEEFGDLAIRKLRENPYYLLRFDPEKFKLADQFALELGVSPYAPERIQEGILSYINNAVRQRGDLCVSKREIKEALNGYLMAVGVFGKLADVKVLYKLIDDAFKNLIRLKKIVIEDTEDYGELVYLAFYHAMEERVVRKMKLMLNEDRLSCVPESIIEKWMDSYEIKADFKFAEKQKNGIKMALTSGISILTGGPGTGKTQTINSIIRCLLETKPHANIHLLAPTGKASKRMTQLTNMEAMTIHRAIGIGRDGADSDIILEGDLVVVDEFSMADVYVFYRLLYAIDKGVSILFVGDADQLPSVGPGLILRDLIDSKVIPTTRLDEVFRQAQDSQIVMNAHRMIEGKKVATEQNPDGINWDKNKKDSFFLQRSTPQQSVETIMKCVKRFIDLGYPLEEIQVLTPQKKTPLGSWNLNVQLQKTINPPSKNKNEVKPTPMTTLREGDRVIHTENNPDLDVFNGEVGLIEMIYNDQDRGTIVQVNYPGDKEVLYTLDDLEELELAYAMTIHKSQGSEYKVVIVPIDRTLSGTLNRNSVYTGSTRAKEVLVYTGQLEALDAAIDRVDQTVRLSQIKEKLRR